MLISALPPRVDLVGQPDSCVLRVCAKDIATVFRQNDICICLDLDSLTEIIMLT